MDEKDPGTDYPTEDSDGEVTTVAKETTETTETVEETTEPVSDAGSDDDSA